MESTRVQDLHPAESYHGRMATVVYGHNKIGDRQALRRDRAHGDSTLVTILEGLPLHIHHDMHQIGVGEQSTAEIRVCRTIDLIIARCRLLQVMVVILFPRLRHRIMRLPTEALIATTTERSVRRITRITREATVQQGTDTRGIPKTDRGGGLATLATLGMGIWTSALSAAVVIETGMDETTDGTGETPGADRGVQNGGTERGSVTVTVTFTGDEGAADAFRRRGGRPCSSEEVIRDDVGSRVCVLGIHREKWHSRTSTGIDIGCGRSNGLSTQ
jgi:hypothetical protein